MELFSTARTAQILDISTITLKRWYKWYEDDSYEKPCELKLPEYVRDNRGTRFFTMQAVQELQQVKIDLQTKYRGCMAKFNAVHQWGARGKVILENKEVKNKKIKNKEVKSVEQKN